MPLGVKEMAKRVKNIIEPPAWLLKTIKEHAHELPLENPEYSDAVSHIGYVFSQYETRFNSIDTRQSYQILDAEAFRNDCEALVSSPHNVDVNNEVALKVIDKNLEYWEDQLSVAELYSNIAIIRGMHLVRAFVRDARTSDVFSMALTGRALLELGIVAADALRKPLSLFKIIAEDKKFPVTNDLQQILEENLVKAIWGTRIGSGDLGDGKGKKKPNTPLYEGNQKPEGFETAKNIMSAIKGRARRMSGGEGKSEYRIYEILSDIVHPSAFGFQMLLFDAEPFPSHHTYSLKKNKTKQPITGYVATASAFGAYQGCSLLLEIDSALRNYSYDSREHIDGIKKRVKETV